MGVLNEVRERDVLLKKSYEESTRFYKETSDKNSKINLDEVKETLNYLETKELYSLILGTCSDKSICTRLKEILEKKKEEEYPEILGVHYYPEIKQMTISKEKQIELDKFLKKAYKHEPTRRKLKEILPESQILFLIDKGILEIQYILSPNCDNPHCTDSDYYSKKEIDKLKDYWKRLKEGTTTEKEDIDLSYGWLEVACMCDSGGYGEVYSLESFEEHLVGTTYKVIEKPDMTLYNL